MAVSAQCSCQTWSGVCALCLTLCGDMITVYAHHRNVRNMYRLGTQAGNIWWAWAGLECEARGKVRGKCVRTSLTPSLSLVKHRLAQKLHPVSWPEESSFSSSPFSGIAHRVTALSLCAQTNAHSSKHVVMCIVRAIHLHHQRCCWKDFTACLAPTPPHQSPCSWESLHWIPHCLSSKGTDISWCTLHSTWCSMQWYCSYCKSHLI